MFTFTKFGMDCYTHLYSWLIFFYICMRVIMNQERKWAHRDCLCIGPRILWYAPVCVCVCVFVYIYIHTHTLPGLTNYVYRSKLPAVSSTHRLKDKQGQLPFWEKFFEWLVWISQCGGSLNKSGERFPESFPDAWSCDHCYHHTRYKYTHVYVYI